MLLPLAAVAAYSCFTASQPSNQEGGRLPCAQRAQRGVVACEERREGLLNIKYERAERMSWQRPTWRVKLVLTQGEQNCSGIMDCLARGHRPGHTLARSRRPQFQKK